MIIINSSCLVNQTKLLFTQFALNHYCADELHCLFVHTADVMNSSSSAVWFAVGRGTPAPILCRCLRILRWCLTFLNPRLSLIFRVISIICFLLIFRPRLIVFSFFTTHCIAILLMSILYHMPLYNPDHLSRKTYCTETQRWPWQRIASSLSTATRIHRCTTLLSLLQQVLQ